MLEKEKIKQNFDLLQHMLLKFEQELVKLFR